MNDHSLISRAVYMRDATNTRTKIQQQALRLFVEKGVTETSVRDLAQAAGIAEGALYRHYASKADLVCDLFLTNYAAFARRLVAVQAKHRDFRARLDGTVDEFCCFFDAEPTLFRFLMLVQHHALPSAPTDENNPVEVVQRMILDAIAGGELPGQPAGLATMMVLGLVLQPAIGLVYGRIAPPFAQYSNAIAGACLRTLTSPLC